MGVVRADFPDDESAVIAISAGSAGDQSCLWAGEVYRMLTRYADRRGFRTEVLPAAGDRDYVFAVNGVGAYSVFKFETGIHRVHRIPAGELQGRIRTSTARVVVWREGSSEERVGTDARTKRIRTYDYQQGWVKEHRINLIVPDLDAIIAGDLDELTAALRDDERRRGSEP